MAITQPDLKFYHSLEVSDAATNGGGIDQSNEVVTGIKNNVWPNVSADDRAAGSDHYRKIHCTPESNTDDQLVDPRAWNHAPTPGDDYIYMFAGTKTDTEATINESRKYGCGQLKTNVLAGVSTITVVVENAALTGIFMASDKIRISNQVLPNSSGDFQELALTSTPPLVSGLEVTLYLAEPLAADYLASNTVISSMWYPGTTECDIGTVTKTSASGVTNESTVAPILNNAGTTDEILTFTWSTAADYTVVGSLSGALPAGNVSLDYTAVNPHTGKNIITLPAGFFTGTWAALDEVEIPVIGNNFAFWLRRVVPAGTTTLAADENVSAFLGESA